AQSTDRATPIGQAALAVGYIDPATVVGGKAGAAVRTVVPHVAGTTNHLARARYDTRTKAAWQTQAIGIGGLQLTQFGEIAVKRLARCLLRKQPGRYRRTKQETGKTATAVDKEVTTQTGKFGWRFHARTVGCTHKDFIKLTLLEG